MKELQYHEAAAIFPLDEEHLGQLAEDIKQQGLLCPIETLDGKIIDGRRRWLACKNAKIEPDLCEADAKAAENPVGYVLSLNLHRRQLTVSQAAMAAARARKMYDNAAEERQKQAGKIHGRGQKLGDKCPEAIDAGRARDQVGEAFGISGKTVDRARQVIAKGIPAVVDAVNGGKISVSRATVIATQPKPLQKEMLAAEVQRKQFASPEAKPQEQSEPIPEGKVRGVGVARGHEAINALSRIPHNDPLRKRGFQIVKDWIRHHEKER